MNYLLLGFVNSFIKGRLSAQVFSEAYIELWRIERDSKNFLNYESHISEFLSSTFCLADMYCPFDDRRDYELDDEQLKQKLIELLNQYQFE